MKKLLFGTAGIPFSTEHPTTINGIKRLKKLKLGCMEMAFVQSVYLTEEKVLEVKKTAKDNNIVLTSHAPYFINLNAVEKAKLEASKYRIYKAAKITHMAGGYSVCFHPGFYLKQDPKKVYLNVLDAMQDLMKKLDDEGVDIWIRPETMGKPTIFGSLKEIIKLSTEFDKVLPCVDFAHLHARTNGKNNTLEEFRDILSEVEKHLGRKALNNMHIHVSGIEYTEKGERHHLALKNSDFNYKDLCKSFKEYRIKGVVISESPLIEKDARLMKRTYKRL